MILRYKQQAPQRTQQFLLHSDLLQVTATFIFKLNFRDSPKSSLSHLLDPLSPKPQRHAERETKVIEMQKIVPLVEEFDSGVKGLIYLR